MNFSCFKKEQPVSAGLCQSVRILLEESSERLALSARAYHRVIKIARTIADLENSIEIEKHHILEAIQYRPKIQS